MRWFLVRIYHPALHPQCPFDWYSEPMPIWVALRKCRRFDRIVWGRR